MGLDDNVDRRSVLKTAAGMVTGTAVLAQIGSARRPNNEFDPNDGEEVSKFIKRMSGIQTADQERTIQSLSRSQQEALTDAGIPLYSISVTERPIPEYSTENYVAYIRKTARERTPDTPEPQEIAEKWGWSQQQPSIGTSYEFYYRDREHESVSSAATNSCGGDEQTGRGRVSHVEEASSYLSDMKLFRWELNLEWVYSYCRTGFPDKIYNKSASNPNIRDRVLKTSFPWKYSRSITSNTSDRSTEVTGFKQVQFVASDLGGSVPVPDTSASPRITLRGEWSGFGDVVSSSTGI